MNEPGLIQGRHVGTRELAQVRQLLAEHPHWSRWQLSRQLAERWQWRNPTGQLKDMAARSLLLKLQQRGWIVLPERRQAAPQRMRLRSAPAESTSPPPAPITQPLAALLPLHLTEVSTGGDAHDRALFAALLQQHHYLSHRSWVGENLQYLVRDRPGRPLACVLWGAAAWQCAARDRYLGWDTATRARHLHLLTNNTRFLIVPWARVPHLGSHVLSRVVRRLHVDWPRKYGHPVYLLETFVPADRFAGACYQAANWVRVGRTQGRSRQDRSDGSRYQLPVKDVYLYPLHPRFRQRLQAPLMA